MNKALELKMGKSKVKKNMDLAKKADIEYE